MASDNGFFGGIQQPSFNDILDALQGGGAMAQGAANGRIAEANANANQDQTRLGIDRNKLASQAFNTQLPGLRAHNAVRGDILAGVQPVSFTGSGRDLDISGGLTPGLLSQGTRNFGQLMSSAATGEGPADPSLLDNPSRKALLEQMMGSYGPNTPTMTAPTPLPHASKLAKIAGALGPIGGIVGSLFGL